MKKALVIGGTRFFGVHLVNDLIQKGWDVTVATRGLTKDEFDNKVNRIQVDRRNKKDMLAAFDSKSFDVIYDQICYSSFDALEAIDLFRNKTKKYIVTSSMSVYGKNKGHLAEESFNPNMYPLIIKQQEEVAYDEGKRLMEAAFFQKAPFPVTAVRFPIVLGENDYTGRLLFYINKIDREEPVYFDNLTAKISFINEKEAGKFLGHLSDTDWEGPINAASVNPVTINQLIKEIETVTGKKARNQRQETPEQESPYGISETWTLNTNKANSLCFMFDKLEDYLPVLIQKLYLNRTE